MNLDNILSMDILMVFLAVATANLDSQSFHTRRKAEVALVESGVFGGAHVESVLSSQCLEVRMRANRIWLTMPHFYANYRIYNCKCLDYDDIHKAAKDKYGYNPEVLHYVYWEYREKR